MVHKTLIRNSLIISGFILILMAILRNTKSEVFTLLSLSLGAVVFYSILYFLFQTEKIKFDTVNSWYKYIFVGISIPLLMFAVDSTSDSEAGFFRSIFRILLAIEVFYIIFYTSYKYWKSIEKLKRDKLEAELMLLKNQINPHFFFNTLNKLYSLIKNDPNAAQDYVLKLSDLMRFTIYDSGKESVILEEEINYLANFIDLQTSRYHKEIDVNFIKNIEDLNTKVTPLMFIILLENAFKHGVEKVTENAFIHLELIENEEIISFMVKNNFDVNLSSPNNGIGIRNLKDRLNLLYPNNYELSHNIVDDIYSTTLEIQKS